MHPRSSFSVRCTEIGGRFIDAIYRRPIVVLFFNFPNKVVEVGKGERFCQIVLQKFTNNPVLREVDNFREGHTGTERSFGSTNKQ